jgi:hypothetical protein
MKQVELEEFFGAEVMVQFREALAIATPGKPAKYAVITREGKPEIVQAGDRLVSMARDQVVPEFGNETKFQFVVKARILPAAAGRVLVCYECSAEGIIATHVAMVLVRPSDIVAVTIVQAQSRDERLVQTP